KGACRFSRLEGAWWGDEGCYFDATSGGAAGAGQIFHYRALSTDRGQLMLVFESRSASVLDSPDNICVSPRGGIVLCQDGSGMEFMHGLTPAGEIFPFAQNNIVLPAAVMAERAYTGTGDYRGSECCGATFEPKNGNWLQAHRDPPRSRRPAARGC
ncbi:MAG TPA: alkaline phosphatase PhoX, partial [Mycobacteriales bacterium]|nr:alkaline phosphatase PhoX [Mycobacteriales bacterium]